MAGWPITTTEAARRLGMPIPTISVLVLGCEIPTTRIGNANCLDEAGYDRLRRAAERVRNNSRRHKREPVPAT